MAMAKWEIVTLDVWGNSDNGYEVNDQWASGHTLELDDDAPDAEILTMLCAEMGGDPRKLAIDDSLYSENEIHIENCHTGRPECVLRRIEDRT